MSIRARRSEILPFTLTETFVLLVFLLLLLLVWSWTAADRADRCLQDLQPGQECIAADEGLVREPGEVLAYVDSGWIELIRCDPKEESCLDPGDSLGVIACLNALSDGERCIPIDSTLVPESDDELGSGTPENVRCLKEVGPDEVCYPIPREQLPDSGEQVISVPPGWDNVRRFVDSMGIPPQRFQEFINFKPGSCWKEPDEPDGQIIYALDVDIEPDSLTIRPAWPPRYESVALAVPGLVELSLAGTISYDDYESMAQPVLSWAKQQRPECRLYLTIYYSEVAFLSTRPGTVVEKQDVVETYFYKRANAIRRLN